MSEKEPFGYQRPSLPLEEIDATLDRADALVHRLLDEELSDCDGEELQELMLSSPGARQKYTGVLELHTNLIEFFNPDEEAVDPRR